MLGDRWIIASGYEMQCRLDTDGRQQIIISGCVADNHAYGPGETWQNVKFWYTCEQTSTANVLSIKPSGCVSEGRRLNLNERVQTTEKVWECKQKEDGAIALCAVGCVSNGHAYMVGDKFDNGTVCYACQAQGRDCVSIAVGCVVNGKRYFNQEQFNRDDSVYVCDVPNGQPVEKLYGCWATQASQYTQSAIRLGSEFETGSHPDFYKAACSEGVGNRAELAFLRCRYEGVNPAVTIEPGCFVSVGNQAIGCQQKNDKKLEIHTFASDRMDLAAQYNLKLC